MTASTVAACQMPVADLDVETNLERIRRRVFDFPRPSTSRRSPNTR